MKFTKEDIHAKFLSDDIDSVIFRRLDKVKINLVCAVLADRLGECLATVKDHKLIEHCIEIIRKKSDDT